MERRARAFYRCRCGEETAGELIKLKRGVIGGLGRYSGVITGWRKKKASVLTRGSHQSARGEGSRVPFRVRGVAGPWARSEAGPNGFPRVRFYFYFSFASFLFCFLYFFILFSNLIQIDSNQICKVSIIQNNHPDQ
jgi:hypothetical protein